MARSQTVGEQVQHRLHDLQEQVETLQKKLQRGHRSKRHGFKLSEVKLPRVEMPEVHMPSVSLPRSIAGATAFMSRRMQLIDSNSSP